MRALPLLHDIAIPGVATIALPDWWYNLEDSPAFQANANYGIGGAYAAIALIALVQLIRIHQRVPEYGWTTQKTFHLLNCIVSILRSGIFLFRPQVEALHPALVRLLLLDLPGLLFFTTYTLLVLFWAEIYHQARSLPVAYLRPSFIAMNVVIYGIEFGLWALSTLGPTDVLQQWGYTLSNAFLVAVSLLAAFGFMLYGGRLFLMLQRFPIESRGRRKKLREVGLVTTICAGCFTVRALFVALSALDLHDLQIDVLGHPLLNIAYYSLVEIFPSACVLFILRKLPPKRSTPQGYQAIPANVQP